MIRNDSFGPVLSSRAPSRRAFLGWTSSLAASSGMLTLAGCESAPKAEQAAAVPKAPVPDKLGVQLYTLRNVLPENPEAVLKRVAEIGFKKAEAGRADLAKLVPICKDLGLEVPSAHFEYACFTGDWTNYGGKAPRKGYNLQAALEEAKQAGVEYVVVPYIPPTERSGQGMFLRLADHLNKGGEAAKKLGLKVGYHHHAFEFLNYGKFSGFEILLNNMEPDLAYIEFDVYWARVAGNDPAAIMRKYPKHIRLVHLKDMKKNTPEMKDEGVPRDSFLPVGEGVIDFVDVLETAKRIGVAHQFVEQDQTAGDPLEAIKTSYDFLQKMKA